MSYLGAIVSDAGGALRRASEGVKITVDQDNIMEAARIIEAEATHFERQVLARIEPMTVKPMGGDPVSLEVARVLTSKLVDNDDSYVNRCLQYAEMLHTLARSLGEAARVYGVTEEMAQAQFAAATAAGEARPLGLAAPRPQLGHRGLSAF
jgi:hypothetical protein